jgi:hypothetical protein
MHHAAYETHSARASCLLDKLCMPTRTLPGTQELLGCVQLKANIATSPCMHLWNLSHKAPAASSHCAELCDCHMGSEAATPLIEAHTCR